MFELQTEIIIHVNFQGIFVFLFYIVLNDQVKSHWLVKVGLQEERRTSRISFAATDRSAVAPSTQTVSASAVPIQADNIYENAAAPNDDGTSESVSKNEFPAYSDDNADI